MSHFRLRRRVRLVVDYLSLPSIASLVAVFLLTMSATSGLFPRPVFTPSSASNGGTPVRPRFIHTSSWPQFRHSFLYFWRRALRRRYVAMLVITMAIALEVCGCDLTRPAGAPFHSSVSSSILPAALVGRQMLSFYDPIDSETRLPSPPTSDDLRLLSRSVLNEAKPSPWAIPESVYFVYRSGQTGSGGFGRQPLATAFVLSVPGRRQHQFVRLLVTARHVVDPRWARCAETNPSSIDLRLNRRSGGVGYETVLLQSGRQRRFFTPSDSTSDVAVMLLDQVLIPNIEEYKFIDVPFRMLPTDAEVRQFRISQPVITARAEARRTIEMGNYPVFDGGVLAKMPTEAVNVQCGDVLEQHPRTKPLHLWLINAGAPDGVSGSPVYTAIARGITAEKRPVLLGVQSVAWPDQGLAGITPSSILGELIESALKGRSSGLDFTKGPALLPKETSPSLY